MALKLSSSAKGHGLELPFSWLRVRNSLCQPNSKCVGKDKAMKGDGFAQPFLYYISLTIRQSFSFQNNPKNLDPSHKMDLDLWDCSGRVKLVLRQNFIGLI